MKVRLMTYTAAMILLLSALGGAQTPPQKPRVPDLIFRTSDARDWSLDSNRGHIVVLNFWATWCGPCRTEVPYLVKIADEFNELGVNVAGVSLDEHGSETVKKFAAEYKINYPILFPEAGSPFSAIDNLPITLLIDRDGRLAQKYTGAVPEKTLRTDLEKLVGTVNSPSTR